MDKIIIKQEVTFEEAQKIAKQQGYTTVIMITSSKNETTIYVA